MNQNFNEILTQITDMLSKENIKQTELQTDMLAAHINSMLERSKGIGELPEIDETIFLDLQPKSLELAKKTLDMFDNLSDKEIYLLAVHYQVAIENSNIK